MQLDVDAAEAGVASASRRTDRPRSRSGCGRRSGDRRDEHGLRDPRRHRRARARSPRVRHLLVRRRRRTVRGRGRRRTRGADGARPAGARELLGLGHPHLRLSRGCRRDEGAPAGRILGRGDRQGPPAARGGGRSEPRALRFRRGSDRAALSRRYPLCRTGPRHHGPGRARVGRRPSGASRRGAATLRLRARAALRARNTRPAARARNVPRTGGRTHREANRVANRPHPRKRLRTRSDRCSSVHAAGSRHRSTTARRSLPRPAPRSSRSGPRRSLFRRDGRRTPTDSGTYCSGERVDDDRRLHGRDRAQRACIGVARDEQDASAHRLQPSALRRPGLRARDRLCRGPALGGGAGPVDVHRRAVRDDQDRFSEARAGRLP